MNDTIGVEFLNKTKFHQLPLSGQMKGLNPPSIELPPEPTKKIIDLPEPHEAHLSSLSVIEAIEKRRSIRSYKQKTLTLEELSYLLWATQGVKKGYSGSATLRNVPSAGARHALETYLLVNNVQGLKTGLYRFLATGHKLQELKYSPNMLDKIVVACLGQKFIKASAVTFFWVAVPERMTWRYSDRGYRYLFLDVGHVCQNLYLSGESLECGTCAIAAFLDDDLNAILGLDGKNQFVIYLATIGKKK
jgi:SagB-type dehydrogenase family enzyme